MRIYWITGRPGSGKTHLGMRLASDLNAVLLDGDEIRKFTSNEDFTDDGRKSNQNFLSTLAIMLARQDVPSVIACVSPKRALREELQNMIQNKAGYEVVEIRLRGGTLWEGSDYED